MQIPQLIMSRKVYVMPYIKITTNVPADNDTEVRIKDRMGIIIELIPRKNERWLMCTFDFDCSLWFGGTNKNAAYIEVNLYGEITNHVSGKVTKEIASIVSEELSIPSNRIYTVYFITQHWGWDGRNLQSGT